MSTDQINPLQGNEKYEKVKALSKGAFGFVHLARNLRTKELVAIKFLERGPQQVTKYVEREILNHRLLLHEHIVRFKEVFLTPKYLCIVMEYAPGGSLFDLVQSRRRLPEPEARWYFQQLVVGIDYCHRQHIVNRDIKLENTLLDGSRIPLVKICDFGYSKHGKNHSAPNSRVGTPAYMAPEVVSAVRGGSYDGRIADMWSCGVMLYIMLVGKYPFQRPEDQYLPPGRQLPAMLERIRAGDYHVPVPISDSCRSILQGLLTVNPQNRLTMRDVYAHPWFLHGLPAGVLSMNDRYTPLPANLQSEDTIQDLVQEARTVPPTTLNGMVVRRLDSMDNADDLIDQEFRLGAY